VIKGQKTAYFGAFRDPIKKFVKVAPMKNYLKTPNIFRRSAPKICRIRRKSDFQRPQKYTYLGAFGVKLKIKFSKKIKNNTFKNY